MRLVWKPSQSQIRLDLAHWRNDSFKSCVAIDTAAKIQIISSIFPFFFLLLHFPLSSVFLPSSIFALLCEFSVLHVNYLVNLMLYINVKVIFVIWTS